MNLIRFFAILRRALIEEFLIGSIRFRHKVSGVNESYPRCRGQNRPLELLIVMLLLASGGLVGIRAEI